RGFEDVAHGLAALLQSFDGNERGAVTHDEPLDAGSALRIARAVPGRNRNQIKGLGGCDLVSIQTIATRPAGPFLDLDRIGLALRAL
ncbi:hypothetical protein, partial [Azohydromonas lata]|uniref:hypothetical protein n=1 Tax=Azohydromonas lata TaxID=45677 RepID=UPI001C3F35FA